MPRDEDRDRVAAIMAAEPPQPTAPLADPLPVPLRRLALRDVLAALRTLLFGRRA